MMDYKISSTIARRMKWYVYASSTNESGRTVRCNARRLESPTTKSLQS
jgi:hypothetical protein